MNLLTHRGPDGFGFEIGNYHRGEQLVFHNVGIADVPPSENSFQYNYFLGHRRLSINDLSDNAFQPMESVCERYSIIFNGEIYNYIELKEELIKAGCKFKTDHSDTEVLLNAFLLWEEKCLDKLRGMFTFAIYDRCKKKIFMARDRIGQKTLYYYLTEDKFIFASELSSIIKYENSTFEIDTAALGQYLIFGYVLHPLVIYKGIRKLSPATYAWVDLEFNEISLHEYWHIDFSENNSESVEDYVGITDKSLFESVLLRLRADVPIGAFISGGTDSTLIVMKIKEILKNGFDVYGADFPGTKHSEGEYIKKAAKMYKSNLHLLSIDLSKYEDISNIISVFDEPFDGGSSIALFSLFNEATKKYKVILTGDGGDELFAGYLKYRRFSRINNFVKRINCFGVLNRVLAFLIKNGIYCHKLKRLWEIMTTDRITNYLQLNYNFYLVNLLKDKQEIKDTVFETINKYKSIIEENKLSVIKALQYLELKTILPGRMLYKLDRFSMKYSVEARSPFLDHKLVEQAFSIPERYHFDKNKQKIILKKILEKDFSREFVHREKQGFGNPLDIWFNSAASEEIFEILLNKKNRLFQYVDYDKLHKIFPQIKKGYDGNRPNELWRMIVLGHFIENNKEYISVPS